MEQDTVYTYLDSYCERAGDPSLWGEPLNPATNLFFLLAAFAAVWAISKLKNYRFRDIADIWLLVISLIGIAIGSGLWHLVPNGDTVLMDVIPITAFIHIYLIAALRRLFKLDWWKVGALIVLYIAVGDVGAQKYLPPDLFNGTIMYIPTYLTLVLLTCLLWARDKEMGRIFMSIVLVWTGSLIFRTVDAQICTTFPLGTHFLWHTLNAWVLYRLLTALLKTAK